MLADSVASRRNCRLLILDRMIWTAYVAVAMALALLAVIRSPNGPTLVGAAISFPFLAYLLFVQIRIVLHPTPMRIRRLALVQRTIAVLIGLGVVLNLAEIAIYGWGEAASRNLVVFIIICAALLSAHAFASSIAGLRSQAVCESK